MQDPGNLVLTRLPLGDRALGKAPTSQMSLSFVVSLGLREGVWHDVGSYRLVQTHTYHLVEQSGLE